MSYKNLIGRNVVKAFNLVGDLADDVIITNENSTDFDFSEGEVTHSKQTKITTQMIITEVSTKASEMKDDKKMALLKTAEVGDINDWSSLLYQGISWKFGPLIHSDRFVTIVEIHK